MPTHPRQSIREALVALLAAAGTQAGSNVFDTRVYASEASIFISVYALEDTFVQYVSLAPRTMDRTVRLAIECTVQGVSQPEDTLDTLCREVELAIEGDFLLSNLLQLNQYSDTTIEVSDQDAQKKTLKGTIVYAATYRDALT